MKYPLRSYIWTGVQWLIYPFIAYRYTTCVYCIFLRGFCLGAFLVGAVWLMKTYLM